MIVTIEISLYPLIQDYEDPIINFINNLKQYKTIKVFTNAMSTQVSGEWKIVMRALETELEKVFDEVELCSTVIKIINKELPIASGHLNFD